MHSVTRCLKKVDLDYAGHFEADNNNYVNHVWPIRAQHVNDRAPIRTLHVTQLRKTVWRN